MVEIKESNLPIVEDSKVPVVVHQLNANYHQKTKTKHNYFPDARVDKDSDM